METSSRILIARPLEDVYDAVAEARSPATWPPGTVSMELAGGEPGIVGAMYLRVVGHGPGAGRYRHALVEAEPDERLTFRSESESFDDAATYAYEFAAADSERTWLVLRAETSTSGWRSLFAVVSGAIARRGVRRHLDRLRESLEAERADG